MQKLIELGATRLVIPGNALIGMPIYQSLFQNDAQFTLDENYCVAELNEFSKYYNEQLQSALELLRTSHPEVSIVYADYYNAFQWLFDNRSDLGFSGSQACCGMELEIYITLTYEGCVGWKELQCALIRIKPLVGMEFT
ncbi:hypothetical protein IFM89_029307 [Coptis chinensis]|uniref:Uncharacterized protein n=1 Tax=Coptis chinensis TaxID=261450 RepID=A0A835IS58_9MAGN|nr:hypothetical protein IFM89_029307 [Coptis chinensis]